mgnify:CR=1 FL=1
MTIKGRAFPEGFLWGGAVQKLKNKFSIHYSHI